MKNLKGLSFLLAAALLTLGIQAQTAQTASKHVNKSSVKTELKSGYAAVKPVSTKAETKKEATAEKKSAEGKTKVSEPAKHSAK